MFEVRIKEGGRSRKVRRRGGVIPHPRKPVKGIIPILPVIWDIKVNPRKNPQNFEISSSFRRAIDPDFRSGLILVLT
jgi:hypothetical protein